MVFGDAKGTINILKFLKPNKSLYNEAYKPIRDFSKKASENFDINLNVGNNNNYMLLKINLIVAFLRTLAIIKRLLNIPD